MNIAVIFDMNGTVVDTEVAHFSAYREILDKYGISFTIEDFTENWTRQGKKIDDYLVKIKREDLLSKTEKIKRDKDEIFQRTVGGKAKLMPGIIDLLERLKQAEFKIGLESSSPWANVEKVINHYKIARYFDKFSVLDSGLNESRYGPVKKKSSRLKYLADLLEISPRLVVLIGDAEKDMLGAKEAGMKSIAVPNQYTKDNNFEHADKVFHGFDEIGITLISSLF